MWTCVGAILSSHDQTLRNIWVCKTLSNWEHTELEAFGVLFFDPVSILEENKKRTQRMIAIQPARTAATKTRAAAGKSCCLQQISLSGRRRKDLEMVWWLAMRPCLQQKGQFIHVVKCVLALQEVWWMPSRTDDLWTRIWSLLGTQPLQAQSHFGRMGHAVRCGHVKSPWKYAKDSIQLVSTGNIAVIASSENGWND